MDKPLIVQTIQLALTPVFMLVAIGNIMNILSTRLARIVDRSRVLQQLHPETDGPEHDAVVREIRLVARRIHLIGRAILLLVSAGLCVGVTVVLLFIEDMAGVDLKPLVSIIFVASLALLIGALLLFLRETREATAALRIPETYLELERRL
jgi:type IV secretory pathway VirB6-like protein